MLTLNEVQELIKKSNSEFYKNERDVFYQISLHTKGARPRFKSLANEQMIYPPNYLGEEYQQIFENFLLSRHPRENQVTRNWRYSQYKPLTKRVFEQLIKLLKGVIFGDSQYSIILPNKDDENYIFSKKFDNQNLIEFYSNETIKILLEDPNGFIVVIPNKSRAELIGTTQPIEPILKIVNSKDVIFYSKDDFVYQSTNDKKNIVWVNKNSIFEFQKNVKTGNYEIKDSDGYYNHLFDKLPVFKLGGIKNTNGYYDSFISSAIPIADEFISCYSAEQMIDKEASHPYIQQASMDCPTCQTKGVIDKVEDCEDCEGGITRKSVTCTQCNGRGQISINPADRYEVPKEDMSLDMIKIINPNISTNEYHRKKNKELFWDILDALHLTKIDEAQSGLAKSIDQEQLHIFISTISNHIFELIKNSIDFIIGYRNVDSNVKPKIYEYTLIKPFYFKIKTANELLNEIIESQNNNIPFNIRGKIIEEFIDKRFPNDDVFTKKNQILAQYDTTYIYSLEEKKIALEIGEITTEDIKKSKEIKSKIDELISSKGQDYFLKTEIKDLIKIFGF